MPHLVRSCARRRSSTSAGWGLVPLSGRPTPASSVACCPGCAPRTRRPDAGWRGDRRVDEADSRGLALRHSCLVCLWDRQAGGLQGDGLRLGAASPSASSASMAASAGRRIPAEFAGRPPTHPAAGTTCGMYRPGAGQAAPAFCAGVPPPPTTASSPPPNVVASKRLHFTPSLRQQGLSTTNRPKGGHVVGPC